MSLEEAYVHCETCFLLADYIIKEEIRYQKMPIKGGDSKVPNLYMQAHSITSDKIDDSFEKNPEFRKKLQCLMRKFIR